MISQRRVSRGSRTVHEYTLLFVSIYKRMYMACIDINFEKEILIHQDPRSVCLCIPITSSNKKFIFRAVLIVTLQLKTMRLTSALKRDLAVVFMCGVTLYRFGMQKEIVNAFCFTLYIVIHIANGII